MKKILLKSTGCISLFFFLSLLYPSGIYAQCERLVWAEEFNGTSVDTTRWIFGYGSDCWDCLHYYTDREENVTVSNGTLKIIALEESYMGYDYTSGHIRMKDRLGWRYGRMEASIRVAGTPGFVNAFWMMPTEDMYGWWPKSGEIDIMEYNSTTPTLIGGGVHFEGGNTAGGATVPDAETAFHVYAIEWNENEIAFFVDDTKYVTVYNQNAGSATWPFDQPFFIILNLAVGGGWCGPPNQQTIFPAIMEVDYVRVYQDLNDIAISGIAFNQYNNKGVLYSVPDIVGANTFWSVPGYATIVSGQNTHQLVVDWDCFGGDITAEVVSGPCSTTLNYTAWVTENYIANPGFEKGVRYWVSRMSHLVDASTLLTDEEAHNGNYSLDIDVRSLGTNTWDIQVAQPNLYIEAGKQYKSSFWAKSESNGCQIHSAIMNPNNYFMYAGGAHALTTEWSEYSLQFMATESAPVVLNMDMGFDIGRYYLDDFLFTTPELSNVNMLVNGDFTSGETGWTLTTHEGAQATGTVENGAYAVTITQGGMNTWNVFLGQYELLLEQGKEYTVAFDACASIPRSIYAIAGKSTDPWTVYCGIQEVSISTLKERYSFSFTMNDPTDPFTRLGFDLGAVTGEVFFDNVLISEKESSFIHSPLPENPVNIYPNPFFGSTTIEFELSEPSFVDIRLFNIKGEEVLLLVNNMLKSGKHYIKVNPADLRNGIYFCQIQTREFKKTGKMILLGH